MSPVETMWEWEGPEREMLRIRRPREAGEQDLSPNVEGES